MKQRISLTSWFVTGAARFNDLIYFIIRDKGLVAKEVEHARFIGFQGGQLGHMGDRNWAPAAACVARQPNEKFIAVGEDGDVFTYVGGQSTDEKIIPPLSVLRGMGVVDGFPLACGMKRQVYRRTGNNAWAVMHAPPPIEGENAGL